MTKRTDFLAWIAEQDGAPYLWAHKGAFSPGPLGYDCSGLVTCGFSAIGVPGWDAHRALNTNAATLHGTLPATSRPKPGDLVFYGPGPDKVDHVMVWLGDGRVHGASGAGADCTTVAAALAHGACVHTKSSVHYRGDCLGFATSPLD